MYYHFKRLIYNYLRCMVCTTWHTYFDLSMLLISLYLFTDLWLVIPITCHIKSVTFIFFICESYNYINISRKDRWRSQRFQKIYRRFRRKLGGTRRRTPALFSFSLEGAIAFFLPPSGLPPAAVRVSLHDKHKQWLRSKHHKPRNSCKLADNVASNTSRCLIIVAEINK